MAPRAWQARMGEGVATEGPGGPFLRRGLALFDAGSFEQALAEFEAASDADLNCLEAYGWAAAALSKLGRFDEAHRNADHALWLDQYSPWAWNRKGAVFFDMREYARAVEGFRNALENDPAFAPAKQNLARAEPLASVNAKLVRDAAPAARGRKR